VTPDVEWLQDSADKGWFYAEHVGSVRSAKNYRPVGWWFLPKWQPDEEPNDVGPFRINAHAQDEAVRLAVQKGLFRCGQ
jgi:hypothetical protein